MRIIAAICLIHLFTYLGVDVGPMLEGPMFIFGVCLCLIQDVVEIFHPFFSSN